MPTPEEQLDKFMLGAIQAYTEPCWECRINKDGGRWQPAEHGGLQWIAHDPAACKICNGTGIFVPTLDHGLVAAVVCGTVLIMVLRAREENDFGTLNRALDWYQRRLSEAVARADPEAVRAWVTDFAERLEASPIAGAKLERKQTKLSGALTPAELAELGLDEG